MKIAIVGAGVSGLATYIQLQKLQLPGQSLEVVIYESRPPLPPKSTKDEQGEEPIVGNIIGLPPNSIQLMKYIDETLYNSIRAKGYHNNSFRFCTARGHTISNTRTLGVADDVERTITCPRQVLWDCLLDVVGHDKIVRRELIDVDFEKEDTVTLLFKDGGQETADLVIGADGAWSTVKKAFFSGKDAPQHDLHYEGVLGMGGMISSELPEEISKEQSMVFTLGPTGSFGYCSAAPATNEKVGWWFNWGASDLSATKLTSVESVKSVLQELAGDWYDPVIQKVVANMRTDHIYPIWSTPALPYWGNSQAVLLGDAAHTVPALSGLGASLALEDSVVFSLLLKHCLSQPDRFSPSQAVRLAAQGLYDIQSPKVEVVKIQARRRYPPKTRMRSRLNEYLMYLYLYLWTNFSFLTQMVLGGLETRVSGEVLESDVADYVQNNCT